MPQSPSAEPVSKPVATDKAKEVMEGIVVKAVRTPVDYYDLKRGANGTDLQIGYMVASHGAIDHFDITEAALLQAGLTREQIDALLKASVKKTPEGPTEGLNS